MFYTSCRQFMFSLCQNLNLNLQKHLYMFVRELQPSEPYVSRELLAPLAMNFKE